MDLHELDAAVMAIEGFRLVRVGYLGDSDETPEQLTVPEWFEKETDNSVGAYWLNEAERKVYDAYCEGYTLSTQRPHSPSTNWAHGGPLIDKYKIRFSPTLYRRWAAQLNRDYFGWTQYAPTHLEAAMRVIVAAYAVA